jgi:tetratricopeptide (TPR) repeat protein
MKRLPLIAFVFLISITAFLLSSCQSPEREQSGYEVEDLQDNFLFKYGEYREKSREASRLQDYGTAEELFLYYIEKCIKHGESVGVNYRLLSNVYKEQGRYSEAVAMEEKYLETTRRYLGYGQIVDHYSELGKIYTAMGDYDAAREKLVEVEAMANNATDHNRDTYMGNWRWGMGVYLLKRGEYEQSRDLLKTMLTDYQRESPANKHQHARIKEEIAMTYFYDGELNEAKQLLEDAAGINMRAFVPFEMDLARSMTTLGRIAAFNSEEEKASKYFQNALDALSDFPGHRTACADVLNDIGWFHLRQGKLTESRAAYQEAIDLRRATVTTTHPNCADAIKGLADISAAEGNPTSATLYAEEALKILDDSVVPTHPRIAAELVALASIHILAEHPEQAAPLNGRIETILQKPLGPWKEDFLDTTAFYADLLEKAGKPDDAEALRQLHARQKDKR